MGIYQFEKRPIENWRNAGSSESGEMVVEGNPRTRILHLILLMIGIILMAVLSALSSAKAQVVTEESGRAENAVTDFQNVPTYIRPTQKLLIKNYIFDAYGPYPIVGAGLVAGINQLGNSPPEWHQGVEGYSKRFGSDYAIAAIGTTTRYGLAEAFKQDTLYYRCDCQGLYPRLRHAVGSTLIARRGNDGHGVFSIPMLIAPYAGSMVAVYGWYPIRYGAKDAFRTGNYSLLAYMAGNISLEFFYSGPHSLLSRMHLNNAHGSTVEGPNK